MQALLHGFGLAAIAAEVAALLRSRAGKVWHGTLDPSIDLFTQQISKNLRVELFYKW